MTEFPVPEPTELTGFFWEGGLDGRLLFLTCQGCSYRIHPPAPFCPICRERDVTPQPVSGVGAVYSFTVNYQDWGSVTGPYALAIIQLDEQDDLRLLSTLVGCPVSDIHIGMRVAVDFDQRGDYAVPVFRPVATT